MGLLAPTQLDDYILYLLNELTDSALLLLSLFTWEVNESAFAHSYWTLTPIRLSLPERFRLMRSNDDRQWDLLYGRYRQSVVVAMEKQTFVKTVKELLDSLNTLFFNFLSNSAEHGLELSESETF